MAQCRIVIDLTYSAELIKHPVLRNVSVEQTWKTAAPSTRRRFRPTATGGAGKGARTAASTQPKSRSAAPRRASVAKDWASLLHHMSVLYGGKLPNKWVNLLLAQTPDRVHEVVLMFYSCQSHQHLKPMAFRRLLQQEIEGSPKTDQPLKVRKSKKQKQAAEQDSFQQLSLLN